MSALTSIGQFSWPAYCGDISAIVAQSAMLINASGEKVGMIFRAPETGTITAFGIDLGTVTTGDDLKFSIQGVAVGAGEGHPDGVINGSASVETVADNADDTWLESSTTGLNASVTKGTLYSAVVEFNSFVAGDLEIMQGPSTSDQLLPYIAHDVGAGYVGDGDPPCLALSYGGTYHEQVGLYPYTSTAGFSSYGPATNPDERGIKFRFPAEVRMLGATCYMRQDGDWEFKIYEGDTATPTLKETVTNDADVEGDAGGFQPHNIILATPLTLLANKWYRATMEPTSGTIRAAEMNFNSTNEHGVMPGGTNCIWTEANDGGAFTDVDTKRMLMQIIIDQAHDGSGILSHRPSTLIGR